MKKIAVIVFSLSLLLSCRYRSGSGDIVTEKRSTGSFTGINVGGGFDVELRIGSPSEVTVEADDNLIKYVETSVKDGQLRIRMDDMNVHDAHLKVFITAPSINDITASAAATVEVKDEVKLNGAIQLHASSGADITIALDAPETVLNASSGAEINVSGRTKEVKAAVSSGSSIHAKELLSENASAEASSGGSITVHASIVLDAKASSGGNITYRGGANVKKSESSGGQVEKDN